MSDYIHGYSERELLRLREQAAILENLLHAEVTYPAGAKVLEMGCGVGAQTEILTRRSPEATFHSVDISPESLAAAEDFLTELGRANVTFERADITTEPFAPQSFDHVFVCFVLEHLPDPAATLGYLRTLLRPGGTLTLIEGDHGATSWWPETKESRIAWEAFVWSQAALGHDPCVGRRLYPLLIKAGYQVASIKPLSIYGDGHAPNTLSDFVNKIIAPMTETGKEAALAAGLTDEATWEKGIADLYATADPAEGAFFYTWFKAVGTAEA